MIKMHIDHAICNYNYSNYLLHLMSFQYLLDLQQPKYFQLKFVPKHVHMYYLRMNKFHGYIQLGVLLLQLMQRLNELGHNNFQFLKIKFQLLLYENHNRRNRKYDLLHNCKLLVLFHSQKYNHQLKLQLKLGQLRY